MAVFHWQRPTCFDKREILLSFWCWKCTLWVTISMREIVGGAVRHCDLVAKKKSQNFFLACWWFAKIYARKNFPLYGITLNRTIEVLTRSYFHIIPISATLQVHWSLSVSGVNLRIQACATRPFPSWDWDWQLLVWFYSSFFSLNVAKTWVSYILHNL